MIAELESALVEWISLLGPDHVRTDAASLRSRQTATFATTQRVLGVVRPADRRQVQDCLKIANRFQVPLYPVSSGRNWGYGSSVPVKTDCVILDLSRMNRITDFDERLAYITLEPGVTQGQLHQFLRKQKSRLWMDATGSSVECSIIGNTLERGFGHTPYGDHFANVCGLEVVVASGDCIETGFRRFGNAKAASVYRGGVGPYLDGLFCQSGFGIVTRMTVWLMPAPEYFQAFYFGVKHDGDLANLIERLRPLRMDGTIRSAVHIGNDVKALSSLQQYPWADAGNRVPLPPETLAKLKKTWGIAAWNGAGGLYGTRRQVAADRGSVKQALRGQVERLRFLDDATLELARRIREPYRWVTGVNLGEVLKLVAPVYGLMKGEPTEAMIASTYWRKRQPPPSPMDPDRDQCGLLWCAAILPATGGHAAEVAGIVNGIFSRHPFEPATTMSMVTERSLSCVVSVMYDRETSGEDDRAMSCYRALFNAWMEAGYYPYRLGIQAMDDLPREDSGHSAFVSRLKMALDPNLLLAPGRYD